ncbi:MAG TPA: ABC transporter permease [Bacillota bacterium]|nr:ABC transporter permease [Bacillota bacterium]
MARYLLGRLAWLVPTLLGIAFVTSSVLYLVPGDPAQILLGEMATPAQIQALRVQLHLNEGLWGRYVLYLGDTLHGDLGRSYVSQKPVTVAIAGALPETAELALTAWVLAAAGGSLLGVAAAARPGTWRGAVVTLASVTGFSVPVFWLGILLIYLFASVWHVLPTGGVGGIRHLLLPAVTLAVPSAGIIARFVADGMAGALGADFVRTAAAKGLPPWAIVWKHAFRNAIIPAVTVMGLQLGELLSGVVLVETVFAWPGLGRLLFNAIGQRDLLLIQGIVLLLAVTFVLVNLLVDVAYGMIDPRIRLA